MGNLFGKSSGGIGGGITREQLLRSTENPRDFTNKLFQVMIAKTGLTPEDYLKLGRPQTCRQFIFIMANSIGQLFRELQIRPKQDKDSGIVYFQRADVLTAETADSKNLCLTIAYFYIRLFQIFGALAMTVLDDSSAGQVLGVLQYARPLQGQEPQQKGFFGLIKRPQQKIPGARPGVLLQGGAVEYSTREFQPLNALLDKGQPIVVGGRTYTNVFVFSGLRHITFIPDRMDGTTNRNLRIQLADSNYLDANMTLTRSAPTPQELYKVTIGNFQYSNPSLNPLVRLAISKKLNTSITLYIMKYQNEWLVLNKKDGGTSISNTSFLQTLDELIQKLELKINGLLNSVKEKKKVTQYDEYGNPVREKDDFLKSFLEDKQTKYDEYGNPKKDKDPFLDLFGKEKEVVDRQGRVSGYDTGMPKALENHYIIDVLKGMTGQKTVSFCIARAFQLLDANALFQPKPTIGRSGVCLPRFDALPTSVPQSREMLSKVPGLKALDQLYYTQPHPGQKDISSVSVSISDQADYVQFLTQMKGLFGDSSKESAKSLDAIRAKDPNCAANAVKHYLQLQDPKVIAQVVAVAKSLFAKQLAHTKRVIQFYQTRLFLINKKSGSTHVDIHPAILKGGLAELAKVSKEAREILIDYYKGCEDTYQKGVELVKGSSSTVL